MTCISNTISWCKSQKRKQNSLTINFAPLLSNNVIEEWKENYISYDKLITEISSCKCRVFGCEDQPNNKNNCACLIQCCNKNTETEETLDVNDSHATNTNTSDKATEQPLIGDEKYDGTSNSKLQVIKDFRSIIDSEIRKVNTFYLSLEKQSRAEYKLITKRLNTSLETKDKHTIELELLTESDSESETGLDAEKYVQSTSIKSANKSDELHRVKKDIYLLYQRLVGTVNFATLNHMGFVIVSDKFNRELKCDDDNKIEVPEIELVQSTRCKQCMDDVLRIYANLYESGDMYKGKTHLYHLMSRKNAKSQWKNRDKALFWMGTKFGLLIGLIITFYLFLMFGHAQLLQLPNIIHIYRSIGVLLALLWFWSIDVYIFSVKRINYSFVFELNPHTRLTFLQLFDSAITLSILYYLNAILFVETYQHISTLYSVIWPITLFIFFILRFVVPVFRHWSTRTFAMNSIFQCVIAPIGRVKFRDFFTADVLTSLSKVFVDIYLSGCIIVLNDFYGSTCHQSAISKTIIPILICAPYWFRFMQCLNRYYVTGERVLNGFNALKYGLSMSVTLMGALHSNYSKPDFDGIADNNFDTGRIIWLMLTMISTFYLIFWDLKMDWAIHPWKERIKSYPTFWYSIACIVDVLLRFTWSFTLFPTKGNPYFYFNAEWEPLVIEVFFWIIYIAEVFRRCVWAIFRVEKAHNGQREEFKMYEYTPLFFENSTLIKENQKKARPLTMCKEVTAMCLLLVVIAVIIIVTQ